VLGPAGLFVPVEIEVGEEAAELDGGGGRGAGVEVEHDVDVVADGVAHGFDAAHGALESGGAFDVLGDGDGHGLDGGESFFDALLDALGELGGLDGLVHVFERASAEVVIEAEGVADGAAEEVADGLAEVFALDVPEGLVDAAHGGVVGDAAAPEVLAMHDLPEVLDAARVLADEEDGEIFDGADYAFGLPFEGGFAPSVEAGLIGFDFDEDPVAHAGVDDQGGDLCDFHACSS